MDSAIVAENARGRGESGVSNGSADHHGAFDLRRLIERPEGLLAPGAFDMISAKLVEEVGFDAVYLTGYGHSASHLGLPDAGLMTMSEIVDRVHNTASCVSIPVVADGDTGYGNALNLRRTVREFEQAGARAIQIEDQVSPKRCGHTLGRHVIAAGEMTRKIEAAINTRLKEDFLVIARTDARTSLGLDEAIRRGKLYADAGADVIFIESPETKEELLTIACSIDATLMANMVEGGRTPLISFDELRDMGYRLVIFPATCFLAAGHAIREALGVLKREGITESIMEELYPFSDFHRLIGFEEVWELEKEYLADQSGNT